MIKDRQKRSCNTVVVNEMTSSRGHHQERFRRSGKNGGSLPKNKHPKRLNGNEEITML